MCNLEQWGGGGVVQVKTEKIGHSSSEYATRVVSENTTSQKRRRYLVKKKHKRKRNRKSETQAKKGQKRCNTSETYRQTDRDINRWNRIEQNIYREERKINEKDTNRRTDRHKQRKKVLRNKVRGDDFAKMK